MVNYFNMNNGTYFPKFSETELLGPVSDSNLFIFMSGEASKSTPKSMQIHVPRASFALRAEKKGICNLVHFKAIWKKKIQVPIG
jgi:hypothetical protein